jgi:hypothetical protein
VDAAAAGLVNEGWQDDIGVEVAYGIHFSMTPRVAGVGGLALLIGAALLAFWV